MAAQEFLVLLVQVRVLMRLPYFKKHMEDELKMVEYDENSKEIVITNKISFEWAKEYYYDFCREEFDGEVLEKMLNLKFDDEMIDKFMNYLKEEVISRNQNYITDDRKDWELVADASENFVEEVFDEHIIFHDNVLY